LDGDKVEPVLSCCGEYHSCFFIIPLPCCQNQ